MLVKCAPAVFVFGVALLAVGCAAPFLAAGGVAVASEGFVGG